jgi:D-apionolactonase
MAMRNEHSRIVAFGTLDPAPKPMRLVAGSLSLEVINGVARGLRWNGTEVVRAVDCPIRDESWATYPAQSPEEKIENRADEFKFERRYVVAGGALSCRLIFVGRADGFFRASAELTVNRDFRTNRAGFTVLHPIAGVAGTPLTVVRPDGTSSLAAFPRMISPAQPVVDIAGLIYSVQGVNVSITFVGEIFEMEDQRNWSDASFKTYCRPLSRPMPYLLAAGDIVKQEITIQLTGSSAQLTDVLAGAAPIALQLNRSGENVPVVSMALDATSLPTKDESSIARVAAPRILQLRVTPESLDRVLDSAKALMAGDRPDIELEIVIPQDRQIDECLELVAKRCSSVGLQPARVVALPEAYLRSYQPTGPWPTGPTPHDAAIAARRRFPGAQIGGGVLTNFTELNRCRPDMSVCNYITHGATAIVHAADDRSVMESLEGLSQVFASARALAGLGDYRLGLISIGMRSNPYGADVVANLDQIRLAMAGTDPRQRGLFAAAWAIGAVAATEQHGISSIALAAMVGPLGIIYRRATWPQPMYDDRPSAAVYPLFHVIRAISEIAGAPRLSIVGASRSLVGVAGETRLGIRLLLANITDASCTVTLPPNATVRCLDEDTFDAATEDPNWLLNCDPEHKTDLTLNSYAVAFVELPTPLG